jgi:hypothetical protein
MTYRKHERNWRLYPRTRRHSMNIKWRTLKPVATQQYRLPVEDRGRKPMEAKSRRYGTTTLFWQYFSAAAMPCSLAAVTSAT